VGNLRWIVYFYFLFIHKSSSNLKFFIFNSYRRKRAISLSFDKFCIFFLNIKSFVEKQVKIILI